jgi:hypothetical protein
VSQRTVGRGTAMPARTAVERRSSLGSRKVNRLSLSISEVTSALPFTAPRVAGETYNCNDLYVTDREVAGIAQRIAGVGGPLPDPPSAPPANTMRTGRLRALGMTFGGRALLERTVSKLVEAVRPSAA